MTATDSEKADESPLEVRFALAMNGGVSLAVWIGGVCNELLEFVRASERLDAIATPVVDDDLDPYERVLHRSNTRVRVDVMPGASAGGMNAVFLALGLLYGHRNLNELRDLWLEAGSFESLMRDPQDKAAPSLLKGDDYFLVKLTEAIQRLMTVEPTRAQPGPPLDVQLTITALDGDEKRLVVANGEPIVERQHDYVVRFRNGGAKPRESKETLDADAGLDPTTPRPIVVECDPYDDFAPAHIDRLARACRSTASFPGAFETSFVTVAKPGHFSNPLAFLPHQTTLPKPRPAGEVGRYVIDGGTLVNLPVKEAIDAIFEQRPSGTGKPHRVFAIVVPDPSVADPPSTASGSVPAEPALMDVISGALSTIPRNQVVTNFLRMLTDQNLDLERLHVARRGVLEQDRTVISSLAGQLFTTYQAGRRETTASRVLAALDAHPDLADAPAGQNWPRSEWRKELKDTKVMSKFPWVPQHCTSNGDNWGWSTLKRSAQRAVFIIRECKGEPTAATNARITAVLEAVACLNEKTIVPGMIADIQKPSSGELLNLLAGGWCQTGGDAVMTKIAEQLVDLTGPTAVTGLHTAAAAKQLLLDLEIIEQSFGSYEARTDQSVEVIRIDSLGVVPLDPLPRDKASSKVAGVQLGHFASFLKATWRANDWTWGRLDGSTDIVKVLTSAGAAEGQVLSAVAVTDLTKAIQARIMDDELNSMLYAIRTDRSAGAAESSSGLRIERFGLDRSIVGREPTGQPGVKRPPLSMSEAESLLRMTKFGEESLADEAGSDLLTKIATNALATGATVLKSGGPKLFSQPLTALRYVALLAYGLVRGALGGSASKAIATAVFGFGVAVTAIGIYGADLGVLRPIGVSLAIAGTLIGFHRSPSIAVPLIAVGLAPVLLTDLPKAHPRWYPTNWWWPSSWFATHSWVPAVAFATAAVIVGTLRRPRWAQVRRRVNEDATKAFEFAVRGKEPLGGSLRTVVLLAHLLSCGGAVVALLVVNHETVALVIAIALLVIFTVLATRPRPENLRTPLRSLFWTWYKPSEPLAGREHLAPLVALAAPLVGAGAAVWRPDADALHWVALVLCLVSVVTVCSVKMVRWRSWSIATSGPAPDAALVWTTVPASLVVIAMLIVQLVDGRRSAPAPQTLTILAVALLVTAIAGPAFSMLVAVTGWRRGYLLVGLGAGLMAFAWAWLRTRTGGPSLTTGQRLSFGALSAVAGGVLASVLAALRIRSRTILGALMIAIAVWALMLVARADPTWMQATMR